MSYRIADELRRGLVLHLPLSEGVGNSVKDISQQRNNGVITGATWVEGREGMKALSFDGVANQVAIPHSASYKNPSLTVAFWAKLEDRLDRHVIFTSWLGFTTEVNANRTFKWGLNGLTGQYFGSTKINWGQDYLLVGTFDDVTKRQCIYINGMLAEEQTVTGNIGYGGLPLYISGAWGRVLGIIYEARIYNRALDAIENRNLYHLRELI